MTVSARASGRCLCGAVRYELRGPLRDVVLCDCIECQRWGGHVLAATAVPREGRTGLRLLAHVYVSQAGDDYDLSEDGLRRHQRLGST